MRTEDSGWIDYGAHAGIRDRESRTVWTFVENGQDRAEPVQMYQFGVEMVRDEVACKDGSWELVVGIVVGPRCHAGKKMVELRRWRYGLMIAVYRAHWESDYASYITDELWQPMKANERKDT